MRTNCISDVMKILIFAASTMITCLIVAIGINATKTAKELSNNAVSQMAHWNKELTEGDIKRYHNLELQGSEVITCIKKYLGDYETNEEGPIYISVKTKSSEHIYYNSADIQDIKNFSHLKYIKPTASFIGRVIKNENKVILGISFEQL